MTSQPRARSDATSSANDDNHAIRTSPSPPQRIAEPIFMTSRLTTRICDAAFRAAPVLKTEDMVCFYEKVLMPRAAFWIFALLAGLAVLLAGALLRAQYSLPVAAGVPGAILGAFAVYLLYGLAIGKRGLRIGADGALSAGFVRGGRWISRQSVDRANIQAVLHSFDMYGGIPQLLLPDAELLPRIIGQLQSGDSAANRRGGLARMTADLRAGLRVFRVSLSGLSAGDALALEFFVERALRERTAR